jgi:tol-pal system protein YbgF
VNRIRPAATAGLLLAALALCPGCFWVTTKSEGKTLRADVKNLDVRLAKQEETVDDKVKKLQEILDEATKILKRNSADLGADVQGMQNEMREMRGLLTAAKTYVDEVQADNAKMKERITALEQRLAAIETKSAAPATPDDLWNQGKAAFESQAYNDARDKFKRLVDQYPGNDRADDAQYFRGEAYFNEKNYDRAIREYGIVWDKWPDSALSDDAMFRAGEAAQLLKHCTEARAYFGLLRQKFPSSPMKKKSEDKEKELKKGAKDPNKCVS